MIRVHSPSGGQPADIRFSEPISIVVLRVADEAGEVMWEVATAGSRAGDEDPGGFVFSIPGSLVPPELIRLVESAKENAMRQLRDVEPYRSPISSLVYGEIPPGYAERVPARPLGAGRYTVIGIALQGEIGGEFEIFDG